MAATVPVVLIYQEFASLSTTPATPTLNTLVAGASYWYQDQQDATTNILLSETYGTLTPAATGSAVAPASGAQITLSGPPNNKVGAVLDFSSVQVWFGTAHAEILNISDGVTDGATVAGPSLVTSGTQFIGTALPGDVAVLTNSAPATIVTTVRLVGHYLQVTAGSVNFLSSGVGVGSVVTITSDAAGTSRNGTYTVEQVLSATELLVATVVPGGSESGTASIAVAAPTTLAVQVAITSVTLASAPGLILSDQIPASGYSKVRIERILPTQVIPASAVTNPSGNQIVITAPVALNYNGTPYDIIYATVYVGYRALRQDLATVNTASSINDIIALFGQTTPAGAVISGVDARNPLAVGAFVALANTNTPIDLFGVVSDDLTGYTAMRDSISTRNDIYAVVPLNSNISVIAMLNAAFVNYANPTYALTNGVPQKFQVVIGSPGSLPTVSTIAQLSQTGGTSELSGTTSGLVTLLGLPGATLITDGVLPGDTVDVTISATSADIGVATYVITHVVDQTHVEVATVLGTAGSSDITAEIFIGSSATPRVASLAYTAATSADANNLYLTLTDANATFVSDGVIPGDIIQMPLNPNQTSFTQMAQYTVALVVSNQVLQIVNNGPDTALVANELPYGASRNAPVTAIPGTSTLSYQVVRTLTQSGQATALVAVAQSLNSQRAVITWPDVVTVSGLVDGSLARNPATPTISQPAANQPGFYLAAAVGGMTAGLPAQQGFTSLGIAGISQIFDSNTYFNAINLAAISNGGWFVFTQANPSALPTVMHELTTNVASLQTGEFMMVKNFDYVSIYFMGILTPFLGVWNVNPQTLPFISAACQTGINGLALAKLPRIGAPIISAQITSLAPSTVSADRLEIYIEVKFPVPLNTIGLHLVSE